MIKLNRLPYRSKIRLASDPENKESLEIFETLNSFQIAFLEAKKIEKIYFFDKAKHYLDDKSLQNYVVSLAGLTEEEVAELKSLAHKETGLGSGLRDSNHVIKSSNEQSEVGCYPLSEIGFEGELGKSNNNPHYKLFNNLSPLQISACAKIVRVYYCEEKNLRQFLFYHKNLREKLPELMELLGNLEADFSPNRDHFFNRASARQTFDQMAAPDRSFGLSRLGFFDYPSQDDNNDHQSLPYWPSPFN